MRRGCGAGLGALAAGEEGGESVRGALALSDFDEGADEIADHFVEEAIAFELEAEAAGLFDEFKAAEGADGIVGGGSFVGGVGEDGEVVSAEEVGNGGMEMRKVEGAVERGAVEARCWVYFAD